MQNQLSRKRSVLIMLLCALMVLTIPSGTVFADTTGTTSSSVKSATWDQFPKIGNLTKDTVEGVDLSMYQTNLGWKKEFTNYQQKPIANLMTFLKSQGVNTVTVKVAVNPSKGDLEQKNLCTLESGIKTLQAAKAAGMKTNMVLLYADWMTYKDEQTPSKSWDGSLLDWWTTMDT